MRQAVTATLSVWSERRFGYSTLKDSSESLLDERKLRPGLKEDSVIEEKERAENEQEQLEAVLGLPSSPVEDSHQMGSTEPSDPTLDCKKSGEMEASLVSGRRKMSGRRKSSLGALPMQRCSSLGTTAPQWVPDSQAPACMKCGSKFSFTKRRHHCRACGKVFCVVCCDLRFRLTHLGGKEGRVCVTCHSALMNRTLRKDQKKVWFADNLLPQSESRSANSSPVYRSVSHTERAELAQAEVPDLRAGDEVSGLSGNCTKPAPPKDLPPILTSTGVKGDYTLEEKRTESSLLEELERGLAEPLVFVLNANLLAVVKIVSYVNRRCWCVMSKGMHAVGQPEVVILLQCLPEEKRFPTDIFNHFIQIYWDAQTAGKLLKHLSHSLVSRGFLGNNEHAGFLYVSPTFQSLEGLPLPAPPFLFGLLMLRAEAPWFYRYTLPTVPGLVVDLEARSTCIRIPKTRHPELLKALNKSNERVLALGACFNEQADSHLICVQTADGQYQTQAISIHSQPRRVTGSCFFVFSGALKPSAGYLAKSSIVEDGLMVQVTMETMAELRRSLRDMKDFTVTCGKLHPAERQEYVHIQWQDEEPCFNKGIISPIDGKSMESLTNSKTHQRLEYRASGKLIRWTEVFYFLKDQHPNGLNHTSHNRLTERLARAFCLALCQSLCLLKEDGMTKLALRVILDGQKFPDVQC
ncbi:zinc finger FYVE domain-containing protein 9-like [Sinocyclocheilus grahami]|uniref:zinc finger FYVE domain-containing protein 9-like n=1 Tax=Sinocyclocheilus grahami TaxID=75366 RepID=UPI0007ACCC71|nr:PREDICTED: zinc finger FYVE domain-containing protein 9-like [Sinocyclocheilus grahami]